MAIGGATCHGRGLNGCGLPTLTDGHIGYDKFYDLRFLYVYYFRTGYAFDDDSVS